MQNENSRNTIIFFVCAALIMGVYYFMVMRPQAEMRRQQQVAAAEEKAVRILREYEGATTVPAEFFDDLIAAFDTPAKANPGLRKAAKRLRATVTRD